MQKQLLMPQTLQNKWVTRVLPDASGRKTSESFIAKDGDGGIERKTEASSNKSNKNQTNIK